MKRNILVIGSGALASEILFFLRSNLIEGISISDVIGINDLNKEKYYQSKYGTYPFNEIKWFDLNHIHQQELDVIIAIAENSVRFKVINSLEQINCRINYPNILCSDLIKPQDIKLGVGNIIYPRCIFGPNVEIGNHNIFTTSSLVSHDCFVSDYNFFSSSTVGGECIIGNHNSFGLNSTLSPRLTIGSNNTFQTGLTLVGNVKNNKVIFTPKNYKMLNKD